MRNDIPHGWLQVLGVEPSPVSHRERLVSAAGGFCGVLGVCLAAMLLGGPAREPLLLFSVGASAVLLFAAPHSAFSRPWPVLGGHLVSAIIGVACARWLHEPALAAATAVALAILGMYYLRCIHPPGGATALVAVLGGESLRALGFGFVLFPVLFDVAVLLALTVAFNACFPWRRYPLRLARRDEARRSTEPIAHEDFVFALTQMDAFIDVSEDDLVRIYDIATRRHREIEMAARGSTLSPPGPSGSS